MKNVSSRFALGSLLVWASAGTMGVGAALPAFSAERGPQARSVLAAAPDREARVIVKFKLDAALMRPQSATAAGTAAVPQHAQALGVRLGLALTDGRALGPRSQLVKGSGIGSAELAARLALQSDVEYAVADERKRPLAAPNDPLYGAGQASTPAAGQWYLRAPNATTVSAINAEAAWAVTTGKPSVVVGVIDTGVRPEHPDLAGKLLPGYDFVTDVAAANDGDGRDSDPSDPGDYVTAADVGVVAGCVASDVGKSSWHGTETAGLIGAATNNGIGMAGVGRDVKLLPLRVFGKCGGYDSDIQDAMRWAAGLVVPGVPINPTPVKVLNMSLGGAQACSASYQDVINQLTTRGIVIVVAAGNEGVAVTSPANCAGVVAVGGVRHAGTKVGYSNLGPEVALSAPAGNCVNTAGTCLYPLLSTSNDGTEGPGNSVYTDGDVRPTLGTSFSTPLVAGTVALMFSANGALTPAQVLSALKATARPFPTTGADASVTACIAPTAVAQNSECYCTTSTCGAGLLDAGAAVASLAGANAHVSVATTAVTVGTPVALDGSGSRASTGKTINTYAWAITSGAGSFTSATNAATATLLPGAVGSLTVSLTITDSAGRTDTASTTFTVSAAAVIPPAVPPATSGGGGGAMEVGWLLGWLASVIGVWAVTPRRRVSAAR